MLHSYSHFPCAEKKFCICDSTIDEIICSEDSVRFVFSKGFYVIDEGVLFSCSYGYVELGNCSPSEISCHIIKREPTQEGAKLLGIPISIVELANVLSVEKQEIELYLELYDFNYLHWRGVLLPYNSHALSDNILIETCGSFPIIFCWE